MKKSHSILKRNRPEGKNRNTAVTVLRVALLLVWVAIILACLLHRDDLTLEGILRYTPENLWAAAAAMLLLFALKSLSMVIYAGILYAASGILFPLPMAILVNLCGAAVMLSLPYFLGKKTGASAVDYIRTKYPKTQALHELRAKNDLVFSFAARIIRVPSDVASLYMGAVGVDYKKYLLGSMLGILPHTITYPIMGMSVKDIHSTQFVIALCAELAYIAVTAVIYGIYRKRQQRPREE
ncbi:MAG: TVP38/TMEM64 family protein [Oscillospiraceae bacterium]